VGIRELSSRQDTGLHLCRGVPHYVTLIHVCEFVVPAYSVSFFLFFWFSLITEPTLMCCQNLGVLIPQH